MYHIYKARSVILHRILLVTLLSSLFMFTQPGIARADTLPAIVYTQYTCVSLWSEPTRSSTYLADVMDGTSMRVKGISSDGIWYNVLFLGVISAWVPIANIDTAPPQYEAPEDGDCYFPGMVQPIPIHPVNSAPGPFALATSGTVSKPAELYSAADLASSAITTLMPGEHATVSQWGGDQNGDIWYNVQVNGYSGWLWAYDILLNGPDPATHLVKGMPVWIPVAGKGMWIMNAFVRHTDPGTLVAAAKAAGITHLYDEVAISKDGGFYGSDNLDTLLPVAHAAGITVIGWVYPYLDNVAADIAMTQLAWNYRTPSGDHIDGIAADIEENMSSPRVYAYGQVLRQIVGPDTVMVAATYNASALPQYPFPEVAASFNVIAPMDYWHSDSKTTYTPPDSATLLLTTIAAIRYALGGKNFPIEELGQTYDMFSGNFSPDGTEPTGAEITFDMLAAKQFGAIGASYFRWNSASAEELDAFNAFQW